MSNFGIASKSPTEPQHRDKLINLLTQVATLLEDVSGCHLYVVSEDALSDTDIWVMELWESQEAHDEALAIPAVRALLRQAFPLLNGDPHAGMLLPVGGKGL